MSQLRREKIIFNLVFFQFKRIFKGKMSSSETKFLLELDEYCLLDIIKYCDIESQLSLADSCQKLNRLIHNRVFPNTISFKCDIRYCTNLSKIRRIIIKVGKFIEKLSINIQTNALNRNTLPLMRVFGTYIGERITFLKISSYYMPCQCIALQPLLKNVETLFVELKGYGCSQLNTFLNVDCQRLKHLYIDGNIDLFDLKLESLETIVIRNGEYHKGISALIKSKSQLKRFKGLSNYFLRYINFTKNYFSDLEELILYGDSYVNRENILEINHFEKLQYLQLMQVDLQLCKHLCNLSNTNRIRKLKIYFKLLSRKINFDQQWIIKIAENFHHLEQFSVVHCPFDENTLLMFVESAKKLRYLDLYYCNLIVDNNMIKKIRKFRGHYPLTISRNLLSDIVVNKFILTR